MMGFRQTKSKQVKHAHDQMELPRDPQIEKKGGDKELTEFFWSVNLGRRDAQVVIHEPVEDEVNDTSRHPMDSSLIDLVSISIKVVPPERLVVHHRKHGKTHIWQHEEIRHRSLKGEFRFFMFQVIQINHQTKHEH